MSLDNLSFFGEKQFKERPFTPFDCYYFGCYSSIQSFRTYSKMIAGILQKNKEYLRDARRDWSDVRKEILEYELANFSDITGALSIFSSGGELSLAEDVYGRVSLAERD